jgi:hypothetical protein
MIPKVPQISVLYDIIFSFAKSGISAIVEAEKHRKMKNLFRAQETFSYLMHWLHNPRKTHFFCGSK